MSNFSIGDWVLWRDELCYISDLTITEKFAMLRRKSYDSVYVPVKELSKPESKKETKNMQKQVNVGDVVKAEFNGSEADGVVTWVSSCAKVVIFQQQDTGHLFWTDIDNLIDVENKDNAMNATESAFDVGNTVVIELDDCYKVGKVVFVGEDECQQRYYEVEYDGFTTDFDADSLYDIEGLVEQYDNLNSCFVKVIDILAGNYYLVISEDMSIYGVHASSLEDVQYKSEEESDSIIGELRDLLLKRSETGIRKYGTTLDRNDLDPSEWCQHLLEELLDAAGYVLRLKKDLEKV